MRCKIRLEKLTVSQLVRNSQFSCNFKFSSIFTLAQNYTLNRFTSRHIPTLGLLDLEEEVTFINRVEKRYCYTNLIAFLVTYDKGAEYVCFVAINYFGEN